MLSILLISNYRGIYGKRRFYIHIIFNSIIHVWPLKTSSFDSLSKQKFGANSEEYTGHDFFIFLVSEFLYQECKFGFRNCGHKIFDKFQALFFNFEKRVGNFEKGENGFLHSFLFANMKTSLKFRFHARKKSKRINLYIIYIYLNYSLFMFMNCNSKSLNMSKFIIHTVIYVV